MDKYASESNLSPLLRKIFALLVELNDSRQAAVFRNHIKQSLLELEATHAKTIETYVSLIDLLLDAFAAQLPPDSLALSHLKLLKTCLTPPLSETELTALHQNVMETADILKHSCLLDVDDLNNSMMPMLKRISGIPETEEDYGMPKTEADYDEDAHFPQPTSKEAKKGYDDYMQEQAEGVELVPGYEESFEDVNAEIGEEEQFADKNFAKPKLVESVTLGADEMYDLDNDAQQDLSVDLGEDIEQELQSSSSGEEEFENLQSFSDQDIFENVKTASFGFSGDRDDAKPLKAPKAVLKMLRFPDQSRQEIDESTDLESQEALVEGTGETDSLVEDFPMYDDYDDEIEDTATASSYENEGSEIDFESYQQDEMENLHRDFVKQLREVVAENTEFGVNLGLEIDALDEASKINQVEDRKKIILASMKKISESHTDLAKKFDAAQSYLSIIESDKRKLSDELDRARMLSLTDELTALPNRRAFIRRLDDEVSRVKRYGFPLSLVLIDIDNFKQVNDKYGHAAGDKVLRVYAEKILSIFRHHDMIARYGGEEFAVLLPNTDLEGVMRALDKVKSSVPHVQCNFNGKSIPAPTFSAGVAEYRAPESPSQLIERADHALYRAKRLGRNRIEVEKKSHSHDTADQT
jgi:diguanylate cyclase (GGDEF)-like protein